MNAQQECNPLTVLTPIAAFDTRVASSCEDTGLSQSLLEDLLIRHLDANGVCELSTLADNTALSSNVLDQLLGVMRADGRVEFREPSIGATQMRYNLTESGDAFASTAKARSSYIGPAPISAEHYRHLIESQSISDKLVDRVAMESAYSGVFVQKGLLDKLGAGLNSGKAMFVYGHAGTGKTFICKRLINLLDKPVYIPHAVAVDNSIISIFDASLHEMVPVEEVESAFLADQIDPRLVLCKRPFICSGGELAAPMLEISQDSQTLQFNAPLQLKATHGIYMIDDLGRQKISMSELFNRWIVPMESREDFLTLPTGQRLQIPFDVLLVFSTNLNPEDIDDPAFQRRVGHKVFFDYACPDTFTQIWQGECAKRHLEFDATIVDHLINECYGRYDISMAACHPRDIISMALDFSAYEGNTSELLKEPVTQAWHSLFALNVNASSHAA